MVASSVEQEPEMAAVAAAEVKARMKRIVYPPTLMLDNLQQALDILSDDEWVALDLETSGLSPWLDKIAVVTLHGEQSEQSAVFHVLGTLPEKLRAWLSSPRRKLVGHNTTAFDLPFLYVNGVDIFAGQEHYDTLPGDAALLKTGRHDVSVSLRSTLSRRLHKEIDKTQQVSSWMARHLTPEQVEYCVNDVRHLPALRREQLHLAEGQRAFQAIQVEQDIAPVVTRMTINGLPINQDRLDTYLAQQEKNKEIAGERLYERLGGINLRSFVQLKKALNNNGVMCESTAKDALVEELLMRGVPVDKSYEEMRQIAMGLQPYTRKMLVPTPSDAGEPEKETEFYFDPAPEATLLVDLIAVRYADQRLKMYRPEWRAKNIIWHNKTFPGDGTHRIHSRFWQVGTDTGRFSSSDPNLQQVPQDMRAVFGHVPGYKIVACDYSQIEIRVAACIADDEALLAAFNSGSTDIHTTMASQIFRKAPEDISKRERKLAKAMNFCLLFGGGYKRLYLYARHNGSEVTEDECKELVKVYFDTYRGLARWRAQARLIADTRQVYSIKLPTGLTRTIAGKELQATRLLNTSVQGTAAAGLKHGLQLSKQEGLDRYLCATVHDELVGLVPDDEAEEWGYNISECMKEGMYSVEIDGKLLIGNKLPIEVEIKIGDEWK